MKGTASTQRGGPRITVLLPVALLILFSIALLPTTHAQASSSGVWWVGAQSVNGSALPNTGVEAKIQVSSQYFSGCLSFWVSESELSNGDWAQIGYFICSGSTPVAFYQVWNMPGNDVLTGATASISTGAHTFSAYVTSGTTWAFAIDGSVIGTYNMGSTQTTTSPVYALSEQTSVSSPKAITQVEFYTALNVLRDGVWQPVTSATSYGNAWGLAGNAQNSQLPLDSMLIGGATSSLSQGTPLWNGAQTLISSTSTSLTCSPSSLNVGSTSTCTATVTDTSSGASITPTGAVSFGSTGPGTFSPSGCTLAGTGTSSSCTATYTPSGSGTDTITATYAGDLLHYGSSHTFALAVSTVIRSTSASLTCSPSSLQVGSSSTCTATVTDTSSGTSIAPTGAVSFASTGPGAFSPSACTLAGTGASPTCTVAYAPTGSGTDTITATYGGDSVHSGSSRTFALVVSSAPSDPSGTLGMDGSGACANGNANSCKVVLTTSSPSNVIIVAEATTSGHAAEPPSDTSGLTWTSLKDYSDGTIDLHLYYAMATGALSSDTITCNFNPNARSSCIALGITGADQTTAFDQNPAASCSAKGTSTTSSCNVSTTNPDDMVLGFAAAACDTPLTAYSGFTTIKAEISCAPSIAAEYQMVSSTQTNHPVSFTLGTSSEEWVTIGEAIMQS
jgi:hypothetical protein